MWQGGVGGRSVTPHRPSDAIRADPDRPAVGADEVDERRARRHIWDGTGTQQVGIRNQHRLTPYGSTL